MSSSPKTYSKKNGLSRMELSSRMDGCTYVPKNTNLKQPIISQHHDSLPAGHPGCFKMLELVKQKYWWLGMCKFVFDYVDGCKDSASDSCQNPIVNSWIKIGRAS